MSSVLPPPGRSARYRPVIFRDPRTGESLLTLSTMESGKTLAWSDGRSYPLIELDFGGAQS